MQPRGRQAFGLVNNAFIATLQANPFPEFFECPTRGNHGFGKAAAFFQAFRSFPEIEHPRREFEAQVPEIGGAATSKDLDGLGNFIRMAGHATKRLVR